MAEADLNGWTILVLEDEPLIGLDVAMSLEDAGAHVCGPMRDAQAALAMIESEHASGPLDGAVLDVNLGDHTCEAVAQRLEVLGVPYVLHTGNWTGNADLIERLHVPVVHKPAQGVTLVAALRRRASGD